MKITYDDAFYAAMSDANLASARVVAPLIIDLVAPKSVIDVGCGRGLWLKAFQENGIENIFGVDGAWNTPDNLVISKDSFETRDFEKQFTIGRVADLAISLEVAEHISPEHADDFVDALVAAAPVILFSAAIPGQGGTDHRNEQWPSYWIEKFAKRGYVAVDAVRSRVWDDPVIAFFYAQNMLVFVKAEALTVYPRLKEEFDETQKIMHLVHPKLFAIISEDANRWKLIVPYVAFFPLSLLKKGKQFLKKIR